MARGRFHAEHLAKDYEKIVVQGGLCDLEGVHKPLVTVLGFSSLGSRTVSHSWLCEYPGETMSGPERAYFRCLHIDPRVRKIAAQHALNPAETIPLAEELELEHPALLDGSKTIMSSDLMVLEAHSAVPTWRAVAVKREVDLDERTLIKLQIEKEYWKRRGVKWSLVLDTRISKVVVRNVDCVWKRYSRSSLPCTDEAAELIIAWLTPRVLAGKHDLAPICKECDATMGLQGGTSLAVVYHAVIRRLWPVDFKSEIRPDRPLPLLSREQ